MLKVTAEWGFRTRKKNSTPQYFWQRGNALLAVGHVLKAACPSHLQREKLRASLISFFVANVWNHSCDSECEQSEFIQSLKHKERNLANSWWHCGAQWMDTVTMQILHTTGKLNCGQNKIEWRCLTAMLVFTIYAPSMLYIKASLFSTIKTPQGECGFWAHF